MRGFRGKGFQKAMHEEQVAKLNKLMRDCVFLGSKLARTNACVLGAKLLPAYHYNDSLACIQRRGCGPPSLQTLNEFLLHDNNAQVVFLYSDVPLWKWPEKVLSGNDVFCPKNTASSSVGQCNLSGRIKRFWSGWPLFKSESVRI